MPSKALSTRHYGLREAAAYQTNNRALDKVNLHKWVGSPVLGRLPLLPSDDASGSLLPARI